jgi:hypothetical protein
MRQHKPQSDAAIPPVSEPERNFPMFILRTDNGFAYTGRADAQWISRNMECAFEYETREGAMRKREILNRGSSLHGHTFQLVRIG